jgi:hypothetical protein
LFLLKGQNKKDEKERGNNSHNVWEKKTFPPVILWTTKIF